MEKIGIEAVWDNNDFNKGQADYVKKLDEATQKTTSSAKAVSKGFNLESTVFGALALGTTALGAFGLALGGLVAVGKGVIDVLGEMTSAMIHFGAEAVQASSNVQQLNYAAQLLGQKEGYTAEQVNKMVESVNELGISLRSSNEIAAQFYRFGLNPEQMIEFAQRAKDVSALGTRTQDELINSWISGIVKLDTHILMHNYALITTENAYADYIAYLDKIEPAIKHTSEALTDQQRAQAFLNAVMKATANTQGIYNIAMQTGARQMDYMRTKSIPDLLVTLGGPFRNAFYTAAEAMNYWINALTQIYSEGGGLYQLLVDLGAAVSVVTEAVAYAAKEFIDWDSEAIGPFADRVEQAASDAVTWGFDIATNFAVGLIQGASTAIQAAVDYIGSLLSFNLASHSPPKVAPDIIKWGIDAISQWLLGFTMGDYSVLNDIEAPLKDALGVIADLGLMSEDMVGTTWANISKQMIQDMSVLGKISEDTYNQMRTAGMMYGEEIVALAKAQEELAQATEAEVKAEKDLEDAKKRASAAGVRSNTQLAEYNRMLRSGASRGVLNDKLNELNVSKNQQKAAEKEVDEAQTKLDLAKEQVKILKEQSDLQKELLQEMLELTKAQIRAGEIAKEEKKAGGGGGGGAKVRVPKDPLYGQMQKQTFDIVDTLRTAVDNAIAAIKLKLFNLWQNMKGSFLFAWSQVPETVKNILENGFNTVPEALGTITVLIVGWVLQQKQTFETFIGQLISDFLLTIGGTIVTTLQNSVDAAAAWVATDPLGTVWNTLLTRFNEWGDSILLSLATKLAQFIVDAIAWVNNNPLGQVFTTLLDNFNAWGDSVLLSLATTLAQFIVDAITWINNDPLKEVWAGLDKYATNFSKWGSEMMENAGEGIEAGIESLLAALQNALNKAKKQLGPWWDLLFGGGILGTIGGGAGSGGIPKTTFAYGGYGGANMAQNIGNTAMVGHSAMTNNYNNLNLNINNNLSNAVDVAMLEALIIRTVKKALVS